MALLLDVSHLCDHHTDAALDFIYKAASEPPDDGGIWDEHPSPLIRRLVELFTQRGLTRIAGLEAELKKWLAGDMHRDRADAARPSGAMVRWSRAELSMVKLYLESLPPAKFTLDDWLMVAEYLVQRYLPESDLRTEAEWLATKAGLMGRIQAAAGEVDTARADKLLQALPATPALAEKTFGLSKVERAILDYGNARCVENVVALGDAARHRLRRFIMDHSEAEFLAEKGTPRESLQTRLLDEFGTLNRDWRRIAVTEAGENLNQGMIASLAPHSRVKRVEQYRGACAFCRSIDGRIMEVVEASAPDKDGETQIWPGKTNIGRSAAPRRRVGSSLIDRDPHELFWIAAGVQHPHCRGGWVHLEESARPVDPKFSAWMDKVLRRS
jgi:hypothetical protein